MKLILASSSPRRSALLKVLGLEFEIIVSDCDEDIDFSGSVSVSVMELSKRKASAVAKIADKNSIIIGADTVVVYNDKVLGKPKDKNEAIEMLMLLNGNTHQVYTGFTLINNTDGIIVNDYEVSYVTFKKLTESEIIDYVNNNNTLDKAGAYSIQGTASSFVEKLDGDYNNVVGLPIYKLSKYLYNKFNIENH